MCWKSDREAKSTLNSSVRIHSKSRIISVEANAFTHLSSCAFIVEWPEGNGWQENGNVEKNSRGCVFEQRAILPNDACNVLLQTIDKYAQHEGQKMINVSCTAKNIVPSVKSEG